jgi:hypothetical protein
MPANERLCRGFGFGDGFFRRDQCALSFDDQGVGEQVIPRCDESVEKDEETCADYKQVQSDFIYDAGYWLIFH